MKKIVLIDANGDLNYWDFSKVFKITTSSDCGGWNLWMSESSEPYYLGDTVVQEALKNHLLNSEDVLVLREEFKL